MPATPIPPARDAQLRAMAPQALADEMADCRLWLAINGESCGVDTRARLTALAVEQTLSEARIEAYRRALEVWA